MKLLDSDGLSHFYNKLKDIFVRSVNTITPDENGNIAITNVATADNLTSPDNQTSYDRYIYRTSGGDVSLQSGEAKLIYIDGSVNITGRQAENFVVSATNNIQITVDPITWRASDYGSSSGTYTFTYTASSGTWSPDLATYGLTASNVKVHSATASVSGNITAASVTLSTWESQITTEGNYYFIYSSSKWYLDTTAVTLSNYGITVTGTPSNGDMITIAYVSSTPNSTATVVYTKKEEGTIHVATPATFSATGFNQCDVTSMYIGSATMSGGNIANGSNIICYCKAVGGVTNGYVAYSANGYIQRIGWCATAPQMGTAVITTNSSVTSTLASIPFENDGYVVVEVSNKSDLCIHPKWSGSADTTYAAYQSPSVITLPTKDVNNNNLPLASYGMPAIGNIADRLNLDEKIYIQRIGQYNYSSSNLAIVEALGVEYDYDSTNIFYVLPTPITYQINVDSIYTVNDFGTEEFTGTTVPLIAQTIYGQNLRDKLRLDVEPKKMLFTNVSVNTSAFANDVTYADYGFKVTIPLTGVTSNMIPDVMFGLVEATSNMFAPIAETYNGGIYLYANDIPSNSFTIPTIICWRFTT